VRIGLSFRDRSGRYCRSFESAAVDGIGCRTAGEWRLEQTAPGSAGTDYRQAASGSLAARRETRRARFSAVHWGAIAASLALGLTIGLRPWMPAEPVAVSGGALVAAGPLAAALDTQLASNQPAEAPVRIGLSFRDRSGRYCRSFESGAVDGIGCRTGGDWRLEHTAPGSAGTAYRQASSGSLAVAAADMMAGDPLDAAAERAARDRGW
jgi:hypothetical protein